MRFPNGAMHPPGFGPSAAAAASPPPSPPPSLAQLEAFSHGAKVYYRDPATGGWGGRVMQKAGRWW